MFCGIKATSSITSWLHIRGVQTTTKFLKVIPIEDFYKRINLVLVGLVLLARFWSKIWINFGHLKMVRVLKIKK